MEIGRYVLHYEGGQSATLPIIYGRDVRNWWHSGAADPTLEASAAQVAWQGENELAHRAGASIRIYKRTYDNPRPDRKIVSLDFESTMEACGPILLAITVE